MKGQAHFFLSVNKYGEYLSPTDVAQKTLPTFLINDTYISPFILSCHML